ncbi:MAG: DUF1552 domain-containing protein [Myxococcales bacterium]|nr:DUF1552 domain-containing protein [Myxococcales bacterium]
MSFDRRRFLKALGLGSLAAAVGGGGHVASADGSGPLRVVFFVQPHGHVWSRWHMPVPYASPMGYGERSLVDASAAEFSDVLRPLHPMRHNVLAIEGLAQTSALADLAVIRRERRPDDNDHHVGAAHVLCPQSTLQRAGTFATGSAASIDQVLGRRTTAAGRLASRVYGFDYMPNAAVTPFSFVGSGQASPVVHDPRAAFDDLLGLRPPMETMTMTREQRIASLRASVLDHVAREYEWLAPRLGRDGRERLEQHRALVRDLERSLGAQPAAACSLQASSLGATDHAVTQFMRVIKMAFACDLTRVVTFVAPVPQATEFGYDAMDVVHGSFAHESIEGETSCGAMYSRRAEQAMVDLGVWYARHVLTLMNELASVTEGGATLLDRTIIVWLTELSTGTHRHNDLCTVLAGGGDVLKTGRYVRFARDQRNPLASDRHTMLGPAHNRLLVTLLRAFGQPDDSFGMDEATGADGSRLSLRGPLSELLRR